MLGIELDERYQSEEHIEVWPDHIDALSLFQSCSTQWRTVVGAKTLIYLGLDYAAVYGNPHYARLDPDEQIDLLRELQLIEDGALEMMNKR